MIKKVITLLAVYCCTQVSAQTIDSTAVVILDRMSSVIGDLGSCSFKVDAAIDQVGPLGLEKKFHTFNTYMDGADKLFVDTTSDQKHSGYWYNGKHLVYYSFSENNYSVVDTPNTTLEMINKLNNEYEIDFPAADFFYPTFTDDLIDHFKTIRYLGKSMVNGKEHFHIAADNDELNIQMWIANDAFMLPSRFAIIYKKKNGQPQYYASMSEWNINPNLPEQMFVFVPPVEAKEINMMVAKTTNP